MHACMTSTYPLTSLSTDLHKPSTVTEFNRDHEFSGLVTQSLVESPRHGGYTGAPFTHQSTGPESKLEVQLYSEDSSFSSDTVLRSLVFEFPEGLPERLRGLVWSRLLGVEHGGNNGGDVGLQQFISNGSLDEANQVSKNDRIQQSSKMCIRYIEHIGSLPPWHMLRRWDMGQL